MEISTIPEFSLQNCEVLIGTFLVAIFFIENKDIGDFMHIFFGVM